MVTFSGFFPLAASIEEHWREPESEWSLARDWLPGLDRFRDEQGNLLRQVVGIGVLQSPPARHAYDHWPIN